VALHDISVPIHPGMHIYRNNPGYKRTLFQAIADGAEANVSELDMGAHTGTHVDGPAHFYDGGAGTEVLDLDAMVGPCVVAEIAERGLDPIDADALDAAGVPDGTERLLLKSTNSQLWERSEFTHDFIRLNASGAEWVLDRGIRLIGIDYLSIGDGDAHRALLAQPIVALEGLDFRNVEPGSYELLCLPIKLADGSDGASTRALLRDL
jgi:arylformamidase